MRGFFFKLRTQSCTTSLLVDIMNKNLISTKELLLLDIGTLTQIKIFFSVLNSIAKFENICLCLYNEISMIGSLNIFPNTFSWTIEVQTWKWFSEKIFCQNGEMAIGILHICQKSKLRVPFFPQMTSTFVWSLRKSGSIDVKCGSNLTTSTCNERKIPQNMGYKNVRIKCIAYIC